MDKINHLVISDLRHAVCPKFSLYINRMPKLTTTDHWNHLNIVEYVTPITKFKNTGIAQRRTLKTLQ